MSAREIEAEAVKAAERSVGRMKSHIGDTVGCIWSQEVIDAVSSLANPSLEMGNLVVIVSRPLAEQIILQYTKIDSCRQLTYPRRRWC